MFIGNDQNRKAALARWRSMTQSRKELKDAYKQLKPRMGVFAIRNLENGKRFIAQATNLDQVWNRHKFQLEHGSHPNTQMQDDWNTFGESSFVFEILHELKPTEGATPSDELSELKVLEALTIEELQPYDGKGYHTRK